MLGPHTSDYGVGLSSVKRNPANGDVRTLDEAEKLLTAAQRPVAAAGAVAWDHTNAGWAWATAEDTVAVPQADIEFLKWTGVIKAGKPWPARPLSTDLGNGTEPVKVTAAESQEKGSAAFADCPFDKDGLPAWMPKGLQDGIKLVPVGLVKPAIDYLVKVNRIDVLKSLYSQGACFFESDGAAAIDKAAAKRLSAGISKPVAFWLEADALVNSDKVLKGDFVAAVDKPFVVSPIACQEILGVPTNTWQGTQSPKACSISQFAFKSDGLSLAAPLNRIVTTAIEVAQENAGAKMSADAKAKKSLDYTTAAAIGGGAFLLYLLMRK